MAPTDGENPDLRASDAERDAIVSELGQHFQDGRLDQAEFDERITAAMAARTRTDLDKLLTDLPRPWPAGEAGPVPGRAAEVGEGQPTALRRGYGWPRGLAILPLLLTVVLIGSVLAGGWHHGVHHGWGGWPFAPFGLLWLIVPIIAIRAWLRGFRRQWR